MLGGVRERAEVTGTLWPHGEGPGPGSKLSYTLSDSELTHM